MRHLRHLAAFALVLVGCADNAELVVRLTVPPSSFTRVEVDVRPLRAPYTLDHDTGVTEWAGDGFGPSRSFPLSPTDPTDVALSVLAENVHEDVVVRLRFCTGDLCATEAGAACFGFLGPFHPGQRTYYRDLVPIPTTPGDPCSADAVVTVDRCGVGCSDTYDGLGAGMWCDGDVHVCDR